MSSKFRFVDGEGNLYPEKLEKKVGDFLSVPDDLQLVEPKDIVRTSLITVKLHMKGVQANDRTATLQIGSTGYFKRKAGQFIYGKQNLHNGALGIIPQELDGFLSSNDIPALDVDKSQISSYFLLQFLGRENFYKNLERIAAGTGSKRISPKALFEVALPLPSLAEQEKIAAFFGALDERIALTADKVKLLKEQKAGYLQKVFAREIVFTDANGDRFAEWEQLKVEDIFDVTRGQVIAKPSLSPLQTDKTPYPVYSSQTSNKGILGWSDSYDFEGNYLTWTTDGAHAGRVFSRKGKFRCTNVCGVLVEKEETIGFANSALSEMLNVAASKYVMRGLGNPKLMNDVMRKVPISVPSLAEQKKIGSFFGALDERIELTENKLTLLKEQKKGYLQGIFG